MGRLDELKENISRRAVSIADEIGIEIVEVRLNPYHDSLAVQVFADRPTGGIGLEECSLLNQKLDHVLYNELMLGDNYTLEVSSPGLDRPLLNYRDFRRVVGRGIHVFFKEPVRGKRETDATLNGVREDELMLVVKGEEWLVPIEKIEKAKQIII
ncbi:MAG: hypothetical protein HQL16_01865 [Candidatus Omnitrophica bacterium]|nr:hypothetical protein [Candidatus Omnitrophota bacterium]